jgi:hypothetical protein
MAYTHVVSRARVPRRNHGVLMDALRPKELLDYLLEEQTLTPQQLDEFIQANPEEDQNFDYKHGSITSRQAREQGKQTIRRYISGFANSDGEF